MNNQTVLLVLRVSDLTAGQTNSAGTSSTRRTNMTWTNISFRNLLGDMWDKYENFNISLSQVVMDGNGVSTNINATSSNLMLNIWLGGLPLVNGFYDTATDLTTNNALIGCVQNSQFGNIIFNGLNSLTFNKNSECVNINIYYTSVAGASQSQLEALGGTYNVACFIFQICGCTPVNKNITFENRRMIK